MRQYGLFEKSFNGPIREWQGDEMSMDKEYVKIWAKSTNEMEADRLVASVRLDKGQWVEEIR